MWARLAIRRAFYVARATNIKVATTVDVGNIFAASYPATTISSLNLIPVRHKTKPRKKKPTNTDGDESDSDDEDVQGIDENPMLMSDPLANAGDGSKELILDVNSFRLDVIAKNAFNVSRLKAEEALLKGDIYINGELPQKKSQDVREGDEIDYIKGMNADDPLMVDIRRARILEIPDKFDSHGRVKIKICLYQDLTIKSPKTD